MTLLLIVSAIIVYVLGAIAAGLAGRRTKAATRYGVGSAVTGGILGLAGAMLALIHPQPVSWSAVWSMPVGALTLRLDALGAIFLIPLFFLTTLAAIYGSEYLRPFAGKKNLGQHWCFYNLLSASMALVIIASDSILFLLAWEVMSLTSFFLVVFDHEHAAVRKAGWIYLVATHIGMLFLLVFFLAAGQAAGSTDFSIIGLHGFSNTMAGFLFFCALAGFGSKAGFVPFHVWLPEAHPAAPSHVSAVMSGIMIKMGIYGIVRTITLLPFPATWWGPLLIVIGAISGVLGVLLALGQHDLKRLLAYSSVENIGIIALGLGCGLLGVHYHLPVLAILGFAGALLHVVNHAFFKGLLFLAAGCVLNKTGTLTIDRLGGLLKRMPVTGICFLAGAAAICGLPPLNGFIAEFLLYCGAFSGLTIKSNTLLLTCVSVVISLALIGGVAVACFTKAFGIVFLGEPRTPESAAASEPGKAMLAPMVILSAACALIGVGFGFGIRFLNAPLTLLCGTALQSGLPVIDTMQSALFAVAGTALALVALGALLVVLRARLLKNRKVTPAPTWDCGYNRPSTRMQYTASSFADPLLTFFKLALFPVKRHKKPESFFPAGARFETQVPDAFLERLYTPGFKGVEGVLARLRWLQGGKLHIYVLYIALTILALFVGVFVWPR